MNWYEEDEWLLGENAKGEGPRYWDALEQNRRLVNKIYDEIEINPGRDNEDLTRTAEKWRLEKFAKKNRNKFVTFLTNKRKKGEKIPKKKDPRLHSTELLREFKETQKGGRRKSRRRRRKSRRKSRRRRRKTRR
jgi:hypothetical protein